MAGAGGALALLALGGLGGDEWERHFGAGRPAPAAAPQASLVQPTLGVHQFISRPDLRPAVVRVTTYANSSALGLSPSHFFIAPRHLHGKLGQPGLLITDRAGHPVWFKPENNGFDFNVQQYEGEPVLTWWHGDVNWSYGSGSGHLANSSYQSVAKVNAGNALREDLHELNLTSASTALITAYETAKADLSAMGGGRHQKVLVGHAQEIDIATGKVLFDWRSLDHVSPQESYTPVPSSPTSPYDYFHINSVAELADGNLLISARNTWALYKVERGTGRILWRLNGKRSDFTVEPRAQFYWQHHARMVGSDLALFNDGAMPAKEKRSRGLLLSVDTNSMQVGLKQAFLNPAGFLAANQGSTQVLDNGNVLVGWGNQPYFSEFAPDGSLLLDAEMPIGVRSYTAFAHNWVGRPSEPPAVAVRDNPAGGSVVYASWNGATGVEAWAVLAGDHHLELLGWQKRTGFETAVAVNSDGPRFVVVAEDAAGRELSRSAVTSLS